MKRTMYRLVGGTLALTLGIWLVTASSSAADDEEKEIPKDVRAAILKIADLFDKGKNDEAKKEAAAIAKKAGIDGSKPGACELLMHAFAVRSKKGFGVGPKPGAIKPDGIEGKIQELGNEMKKLSEKTLKTEATDLRQMALIAAAVGAITLEAAPKKDEPKKKASDWKKWAQEMQDFGLKLADVAGKGSDTKAVKIAARNLDGSCSECHAVFKK